MDVLKCIFLISLSLNSVRGKHVKRLSNLTKKRDTAFYIQPSDSFFISLENHWLKALRHNDTLYLKEILSPDFIDISYKGEIKTKTDILDRQVYDSSDMEEQLTGMKVRQYKNTAIVTGINNIRIKNINRKILIRFTDVFVKKEKKWQAVSAQETLVQ